jgi:hypothetical protein
MKLGQAFMTALGANSEQSYQQLLNSLRTILREKYSQKPQVCSLMSLNPHVLGLTVCAAL